MPANVQYDNVWSHFHTVEETINAWNDEDGQGNREARERGDQCVLVHCNKADALILSMAFHRYFAIETCCHYDERYKILSMFCGHESSQVIPKLKARMGCLADAMSLTVLDG